MKDYDEEFISLVIQNLFADVVLESLHCEACTPNLLLSSCISRCYWIALIFVLHPVSGSIVHGGFKSFLVFDIAFESQCLVERSTVEFGEMFFFTRLQALQWDILHFRHQIRCCFSEILVFSIFQESFPFFELFFFELELLVFFAEFFNICLHFHEIVDKFFFSLSEIFFFFPDIFLDFEIFLSDDFSFMLDFLYFLDVELFRFFLIFLVLFLLIEFQFFLNSVNFC